VKLACGRGCPPGRPGGAGRRGARAPPPGDRFCPTGAQDHRILPDRQCIGRVSKRGSSPCSSPCSFPGGFGCRTSTWNGPQARATVPERPRPAWSSLLDLDALGEGGHRGRDQARGGLHCLIRCPDEGSAPSWTRCSGTQEGLLRCGYREITLHCQGGARPGRVGSRRSSPLPALQESTV
jgi:hypothetical protein